MSESYCGFFDEVQRLAGLRSRAAAERVAVRVLHVIGRHLTPAAAQELVQYLPRRAACAVTAPATGKELVGDVEELLQEVAVEAETPDPADAQAYLGAVVVALQDCMPKLLPAVVPANVLDAAAVRAQVGHRCQLCSPLPWPEEAAT